MEGHPVAHTSYICTVINILGTYLSVDVIFFDYVYD